MVRVVLLSLGVTLAGCHSAETCRLRGEVAKLSKENAELRAELKKLIQENARLSDAAFNDDDADDDADDDTDLKISKLDIDGPDAMEHLLAAAQDEYVHGRYRRAIDLARHAAPQVPQKAWRVIGAAQCFLKDRPGVVEAVSHLDAQGKQFLKYVCSRNDIRI
jgi:hypothetical protein